MRDNVLLIFLKAPVPGAVKTRLALTRGAQEAARLYVKMAREVYGNVKTLPGISTVVAYEKSPEFMDLCWLDEQNPDYIDQQGADLGRRLEEAFRWAFCLGIKRVAAVGGDSPGLSSGWVIRAFEDLGRNQVVLGPSEDGGYYLIGSSRFEPGLFRGIPWSTSQVFQRTVEKSQALGLHLSLLPMHFDVDDEPTLKRWLPSSATAVPPPSEEQFRETPPF